VDVGLDVVWEQQGSVSDGTDVSKETSPRRAQSIDGTNASAAAGARQTHRPLLLADA
jgi:hypothetical protein